MSPEQCRAARGWLGWSQQGLANQAKVGISTVKAFEGGKRAPIANNLAAIRKVFTDAGVEFLIGPDGGAAGIKVVTRKP